jgi:hypothetical protein
MTHWNTLRLPVFNLAYEDLVNNPEDQLNTLFEFLGCKYEQNCLSFYNQKRAVTTLSKQAVRQPVNTNAVSKWERYQVPLLKLMNKGDS